jgi:hypothetical protein
MELTGICKKKFEKWFTNSDNHKGFDAEQVALDRKYRLNLFYQLTKSMQYGVYVDFFDSVGIEIYNLKTISELFDKNNKKCYYIEELKTRPEARTKAIEKANEIYNLNQ